MLTDDAIMAATCRRVTLTLKLLIAIILDDRWQCCQTYQAFCSQFQREQKHMALLDFECYFLAYFLEFERKCVAQQTASRVA